MPPLPLPARSRAGRPPPPRHALRPARPPLAASARPRGQLRRSLRASTLEGIAAEVVGACTGGAAITGWALHLGCAPATLGLLGTLPFVAHVLQLPAARLTARHGARRVALVSIAIARQAFLPLALLPFLPVPASGAAPLLVGAAAALHGLGIVCNNGWVAWMGEVVPARLRGRYFGRRTAVCTAAGAGATLAAGALLDTARAPEAARLVLAGLAAVACLAGAVSTVLMARQHGGHPRPAALRGRASALDVLRAPAPRRLAGFLALSGAASGLAGPYFGLYVLRDLGLGFGVLAAHGVATALARTAAAARWGAWVDRPGGARRVLGLSTLVLAASPLLWLAAARWGPWLLLVEAAVSGAAAAGASVAGLALPLALAPPAERPAFHAAFSMAGGLAFGAGAAAAARLAAPDLLPWAAGPLAVPFLACALLRVGSAALARSVPDASPGR